MIVGFKTVKPLVDVVTDAATISQAMEIASKKYARTISIFPPLVFRKD